jgi:polyvinyl alcohol dehydrogenase (cytochrome)
MAAGLSADEIKDISLYLTGKPLGADPKPGANMCASGVGALRLEDADWRSFGVDLRNTLFQRRPGLSEGDIPKLRPKWTFAYAGGAATAEPVLAGGRLFLTTASGLIALDARSGCTLWHSDVGAAPKIVTVGTLPADPDHPVLFFGDSKANVLAVSADTGKLLWTVKVDDHPNARITGPVSVFKGRVYAPVSSMEDPLAHDPSYPCCTFRGSVVSLDAGQGKLLWKTYSISTPPMPLGKKSESGADLYGPAGGAIYAPLAIDEKRNVVYATSAESYHRDQTDGSDAVIALDLDTGARKWVVQPRPKDNAASCAHQDEPDACDNPASAVFEFAAPPVLANLSDGKQVLLVGQKSGVVFALDPDDHGRLLWEQRVGEGGSMGGIENGFAVADNIAYVPVSDSEVKSPYVPGGIAALDLSTGTLKWKTRAPRAVCSWGEYECNTAQAGAAAVMPGAVFSGSWDGHVRAYRTTDGKIIWDFDTAKTFDAVNGVKATGGAVSGYSIIIGDGTVFVTSGAQSITHPGNALIALTPDGK